MKARTKIVVKRGRHRARPLGPKAKAAIRALYFGPGGRPKTSLRKLSEKLGIGVWQVYAAVHPKEE